MTEIQRALCARRKPSSEVRLYEKPAADCCPETGDDTADDMEDVNSRQYAGYLSCSDRDVTPYVTPPEQPETSGVTEVTRRSEHIIRCSVCATIVTSRSDGDVTASDNQSRRCVASSPVDDDVNVPV